jgi:hypothetical protein
MMEMTYTSIQGDHWRSRSTPADIALIILRLSFNAVKGNLKQRGTSTRGTPLAGSIARDRND